MKSHAKVLIALTIIAFLIVPSTVISQQLPVPVEKSVFPGVTTIQYAGHTLVFTTSVALKVKLRPVDSTKIILAFKAYSRDQLQGPATAAGPGQTVVFWENTGEEIYNDAAPGEWNEIPLTEGGWTEK
ncbi:MAG: hypothetical protein OEN01_05105 [Candidatus Krumholzibacteria bacterium]|nr:hypothetical protein [Candidatus Krumholzibacteria bacterium]